MTGVSGKGIFSLMLLLLAASVCNGQAGLAEGSFQSLQTWVVTNLKKNGTYSDDFYDFRISAVTFEGCRINIRSERSMSVSYSNPPAFVVASVLSFDLSEINPSEIAERLINDRKMRVLRLNAIGQDDVISLAVRERYEIISTMEKSASITVRKKILKELKENLIAMIRYYQRDTDKGKNL